MLSRPIRAALRSLSVALGLAALRRRCAPLAPTACLMALVAVPLPLGGVQHFTPPADRPARAAAADPTRVVYSALGRCRSLLSDAQRRLIANAIIRESDRHGYDPLFVQALIEVESTCKPTARSNRGAVGLTQVKPETARAVAADAGLRWHGAHSLTEPEFNVRIGVRYLAQLEEELGDPYLAVAAYNLGPAQVARMPRHRARDTRFVRRVLARYERLLAHPTAL